MTNSAKTQMADEKLKEYLKNISPPPKRVKRLIKVNVSRAIAYDQVATYTRNIADEVFKAIPPEEDGDIDIVVTLDFSGNLNITPEFRKFVMDSLEEELLR